MENIIIIGSGPAGASAALYTARAGMHPLILSQGMGALGKTERVENFYGIGAITGSELHDMGEKQAQELGARLVRTQVVGISGRSPYTVSTTSGDYETAAIILATGVKRKAPPVAGIQQLEGRGVSYCAVCDGFFYRGKHVAVLGNGDFARKEAQELSMAASVTILTNGMETDFHEPCAFPVDTRPIQKVMGKDYVQGVQFKDDATLPIDGLFVALGVAGGSELVRRVGAALDEKGNVQVDKQMKTTLPGLYAAGDCIGGVLQIAKAVENGMTSAVSAIQYVRQSQKK